MKAIEDWKFNPLEVSQRNPKLATKSFTPPKVKVPKKHRAKKRWWE